jgi:hypothetical protein
MATNPKSDDVGPKTLAETIDLVRVMQNSIQQTESHLQHVEEVGKVFDETQRLMDDKLDGIHKLLTQWNSSSESGSASKSNPIPNTPSLPPHDPYNRLTEDELAFLKH